MKLEKTVKHNKDFSYKKGSVELNFSLNIDNSSQLRDFRTCLEQALNDVSIEIKEMKN